MRRFAWFTTAVVAVAVAAPAFAGHGAASKSEKCSYDAQTCLNGISAKKDKGWLGLELDYGDAGVMAVKKVVPSSPAERAGFMAGDVLVSRNGIKMSDHEALKADKSAWKVGARVTYTVQRKSVEKSIPVTLVAMPEEVFARMVGDHMISDHMTATTAAATTESKGTEAKAAEVTTATKAAAADKK